jgi:ketosteroid isomerase-like protein
MPEPGPTKEEELTARLARLQRECRVSYTMSVVLLLVTLLLGGWVLASEFANRAGKERIQENIAPADESAIRAVLGAQVKAWNSGDLDGFMAGYWRDEKLQFMSGDRITRGWDATRDRYQKKYFTPDKDGKLTERGELAFAELEVESLSPNAAVVRGRYILKLTNETATGRFTLVFRVIGGEWKITSDHTSAADKSVSKKKE